MAPHSLHFIYAGTLCFTVFSLSSQVVITLILVPALVAMFVPLAVMYWFLQRSYSQGFKPLSTLEAVKLAPVIAASRDALEGMITIRAFGREEHLLRDQLGPALRTSGSYSALLTGSAACLAFFSNCVVYGIMATVTSITLAAAFTPSTTSAAPMIMSNIFQLSGVMAAAAIAGTTLENALLSAHRLMELSKLTPESEVWACHFLFIFLHRLEEVGMERQPF